MITATKYDADDDNNDANNDDDDDGNNNDGNGQNGAAFHCAVQRAQVLAGCLTTLMYIEQIVHSAPELAGYSGAHCVHCTMYQN